MRKIFKERDTEWHYHFAWLPVYARKAGHVDSSVIWMKWVQRRWVNPFYDGLSEWPGFYQYIKF